MKRFSLCIALVVWFAHSASSQESRNPYPDPPTIPEAGVSENYVITLAVYRLDHPIDSAQKNAAELIASLTASENKPTETIHLSVVSGFRTMVQFGSDVSVTTGSITNRGSTARQMETRSVGTLLTATITPKQNQLLVELNYSSSQIAGDEQADSHPSVVKNTIETSLMMEIGKPMLVSGLTKSVNDKSTLQTLCYVMTVTQ
ncbi:type II and III secretion system protein [Novipirellula artificiosorum]|uniref:Bacterial type II and III secretion system protein n=1 Tax=Novipirellula artificiosorum TaxID=2528016 RepID=A0A5C6DKP4_9BACT|nr:type II and III secretion system protein [Novipirellula artificiosorum]TWU37338.1 hypothetical protein Poly41_34680 [Novipirellula artificiosorum]